VVRPARPEDADAVADVYVASFAGLRYLPPLHTDDEKRAWIRGTVLPQQEVWVAERDGRVVGFGSLSHRTLELLYVRPEAQGLGAGALLLAKAKERRPGGFRLWVFQQNEGARRFYERHGLRLVELTDGAANEEREPDALYEWRPTPRPK
jgi:ribosomal protein S18 acetylase RimI-like enzyme